MLLSLTLYTYLIMCEINFRLLVISLSRGSAYEHRALIFKVGEQKDLPPEILSDLWRLLVQRENKLISHLYKYLAAQR